MLENDTGRLLLVSNRLPVTIRQTVAGSYEYHESAGGLVSGLNGLLRTRSFQWYGWPGIAVSEARIPSLEKSLRQKYNATPIWLDEYTSNLHYNDFCNSVLWPLLHYRTDNILFSDASYRASMHVNNVFADVIVRDLEDRDVIWIHDYHLFLLPLILQKKIGAKFVDPKVKVGFFLHVPFPSPDVFAALPVKNDIVESLLCCDVVGFHTDSYAQNFMNVCSELVGATRIESAVLYRGRKTEVKAFPIGIDPVKFKAELGERLVQDRICSTKRIFGDTKLICGVDRLDFIKGIPYKLRAFEKFLTARPDWLGKVSLIQVVVPSRESLPENQELKAEIDLLAQCINDKYRSLGFMPVHIMHRQVSFGELLALYAASDVCAITSLRDGMNLVASEYVASQSLNKGCLVLSEFTGAAQSLHGYIRINPWDTTQVSQAFAQALEMGESERNKRWRSMYDRIVENTSSSWGEAFVSSLEHGDIQGMTPRRRSQAGFAGQDMSSYYAS